MKKRLLLAVAVGLALFFSCRKEDVHDRLAGTTWKRVITGEYDDHKIDEELVFTSTDFNYTYIKDHRFGDSDTPWNLVKTQWGFSGTYTYDHPTVTIKITSGALKGTGTGSVRDSILFLRIPHDGGIWESELTKR